MQLFIAEKPSAAKALATELGITGRGDGFIRCGDRLVTWCFGHLFEQADPDAYTADDIPRRKNGRKVWREQDLPVVPQRWILEPKHDAKQQLAVIGRLLRDAREIVHAGDPDREGQLLVDEVLEHFSSSKAVRRFWVSAQDATSIRRGLENLRDNAAFRGMADAARARQRADWLIGMNLSRAFTLQAQRSGATALLTVGRVQTPTLALVVARDREIEGFTPRPYHVLHVRIEHAAGQFVATWKPREDQAGFDEEGRLVDCDVADALITAVIGKPGQVVKATTEPKKKRPPLCFALSDLTLLASQRYGYGAEQVMRACQSLYEVHKLVSYPRTDSGYLPRAQHADARSVLVAIRQVNPALAPLIDDANARLLSPTWNDAKVTAHHGIVPTMHAGTTSTLDAIERNVYDLIVRRYVAQFYPDHEYLETHVAVDVASETFVASGKRVTAQGWLSAESLVEDCAEDGAAERDDTVSKDQSLPPMQQGDAVRCIEARRKATQTKPPKRFTDGTLIRAMEQIHKWVNDSEQKKLLREGDGIGTPATRAAILGDLKRRDFLLVQGKAVVSTALGRALIDALPEAVKSAALTALFERVLRDVERGEVPLDAFVERQAAFVRERVAAAKLGPLTLPVCIARPQRPIPTKRRTSTRARRAAKTKKATP